ncbi:MAG TPA: hypothetical protein VJN21_05190 [Candidatus Acidoferrales bacterium]|nr:hypothetical protein [Candidatus Acidoferrales bacterium]
MRRFAACFLLFAVSLCTYAAQGDKIVYTGGTAASIFAGTAGRFDTSSPDFLVFEYAGKRLTIPYATIDSFQYSQPVARHLGVLPAIAVTLFAKRSRKHVFRISYREETGAIQVAIFEVPKQEANSFLAILQTKATKPCQAHWTNRCSQPN